MKAMIYKRYGGPEVLTLKEVEKPEPNPNELLVKVEAATVNRTDCANLRGKPFVMHFVVGFLRPKKSIGGTEFAGVVKSVGANVSSFKPGDRVFGFDDEVLSSHAEYLAISEDAAVAKIPGGIEFATAAASMEGAHYALSDLAKVELQAGQKVLVNGASGAIGSALVQLLKLHPVEVTAVTEKKHFELVKGLGASHLIDYLTEDFTTRDAQYDFVFDAVGKSSFSKCKSILTPKGIYLSSELGAWGVNLLLSAAAPLSFGKKVKFPFPGKKKDSVEKIRDLLAEGKFSPLLDREYSLEELPDAFRYAETETKVGNIVVLP